jgi:hypothetical protein
MCQHQKIRWRVATTAWRLGIFLETTARRGCQQPLAALRKKLFSRLIQQNASASLKTNEIRLFGKMEEKFNAARG